jgi:hypothetical protein
VAGFVAAPLPDPVPEFGVVLESEAASPAPRGGSPFVYGAAPRGDVRPAYGASWTGPAARTSPAGDTAPGLRASYRFRTAWERLPAGLPGWFCERDANRDGQVAMHEFAVEWSDELAIEFQKVDFDNDGMLTPKECLASQDQASESDAVQHAPRGPLAGEVNRRGR